MRKQGLKVVLSLKRRRGRGGEEEEMNNRF